MAQILPFPVAQDRSPLALFVRIGSAHKKIADLYAAGRLPAKRMVIDASQLRFSAEFLKTLREDGVEVVLDTEIAELSSSRRFPGHARNSPWLRSDWKRPFTPEDFTNDAIIRLAARIAETAVAAGITAVLSPTHFISDRKFDGWFTIDQALCVALRDALDSSGGENIAIDYPVILANAELRDVAVRGTVLSAINALPIDNVWIRASGIDGVGGPLKTTQFLTTLERLHNLSRPLVVDYLGGLTGQAALAFGSASGLAHGIGEKERFYAGDWHLPPEEKDVEAEGFGRSIRIEVADLGKAPTRKELELLISAPGGRRVCSCADKRCCPHGLDDMVRDPRSHAAYRALQAVEGIEAIPVPLREGSFIAGPLENVRRTARTIAKLKPSAQEATRLKLDSDNFMRRLTEHSHHIDSLVTALEHLHEQRSPDMPGAKALTARASTPTTPKEAKK